MVKTIYFDMDGVLADWIHGFEKLFPHVPYSQYNALTREEQKPYRKKIDGNGYFYQQLRPFTKVIDALVELKRLGYQVEILSSVGKMFPDLVIQQKQAWLKKHVEIELVANFVNKSEYKARYAHKNALLLDDRARSVNPFLKAGGKSIIFHGDQVSEPQQLITLVEQSFDEQKCFQKD